MARADWISYGDNSSTYDNLCYKDTSCKSIAQSKVLQDDWVTLETHPISSVSLSFLVFLVFSFRINSTSFMSRFTAVCLLYVSNVCVFDATSWEQNLIMILYVHDVEMILSFIALFFVSFKRLCCSENKRWRSRNRKCFRWRSTNHMDHYVWCEWGQDCIKVSNQDQGRNTATYEPVYTFTYCVRFGTKQICINSH